MEPEVRSLRGRGVVQDDALHFDLLLLKTSRADAGRCLVLLPARSPERLQKSLTIRKSIWNLWESAGDWPALILLIDRLCGHRRGITPSTIKVSEYRHLPRPAADLKSRWA